MAKARFEGDEGAEIAKQVSDGNLVVGLQHPEAIFRQRVALSLGTTPKPEALPDLLEHLFREPEFFVRETLVWAVASYGTDALPRLYAALDATSHESTTALHAISKIAAPESFDQVTPLLLAKDQIVVCKAVWTLGVLGEPRAIGFLMDLLIQPPSAVANEIVKACTSLAWKDHDLILSRANHEHPNVRQHIAAIIANLWPIKDNSVAALETMADDSDEDVAIAAIVGLADINRSWDLIERCAADDTRPMRQVAATKLCERRNRPTR